MSWHLKVSSQSWLWPYKSGLWHVRQIQLKSSILWFKYLWWVTGVTSHILYICSFANTNIDWLRLSCLGSKLFVEGSVGPMSFTCWFVLVTGLLMSAVWYHITSVGGGGGSKPLLLSTCLIKTIVIKNIYSYCMMNLMWILPT